MSSRVLSWIEDPPEDDDELEPEDDFDGPEDDDDRDDALEWGGVEMEESPWRRRRY